MIIIKNEETFIFVKWGGGGGKEGVPEGTYTYYLVLNKVL